MAEPGPRQYSLEDIKAFLDTARRLGVPLEQLLDLGLQHENSQRSGVSSESRAQQSNSAVAPNIENGQPDVPSVEELAPTRPGYQTGLSDQRFWRTAQNVAATAPLPEQFPIPSQSMPEDDFWLSGPNTIGALSNTQVPVSHADLNNLNHPNNFPAQYTPQNILPSTNLPPFDPELNNLSAPDVLERTIPNSNLPISGVNLNNFPVSDARQEVFSIAPGSSSEDNASVAFQPLLPACVRSEQDDYRDLFAPGTVFELGDSDDPAHQTLLLNPMAVAEASSSTDIHTVPHPGDMSGGHRKELATGPIRYPSLAPKPRPDQSTPCLTVTNKKRRVPYSLAKRQQTSATRRMKDCIRCRMNRKRCEPDLADPSAPCLRCQRSTFNIFRLPCLRYIITDCVLFRTEIDSPFFREHPMVGQKYGDFHLRKVWVNSSVQTLHITQDYGTVLRIRVRQFQPPDETITDTLGLKGQGNPIYLIPWALTSSDECLTSVESFLDQSIEVYIQAVLDESELFTWSLFDSALRMSVFPEPNPLLSDVLRLWTASRMIEGKWRCCGVENLGAERLVNPLRDADWISIPQYISFQLASVVMNRILMPLRYRVLFQLQKLVLENKSRNWYIVFLTMFVMLHNYELQTAHSRSYAAKRKLELRWPDMPLLRATHSGAKTLLAHFHYICKGNMPWQVDFDWDSPTVRKMAELDNEQINILKEHATKVGQKNALFQSLRQTDKYETQYWFTSQLFEPDWIPRDTYEHSPVAEPEP